MTVWVSKKTFDQKKKDSNIFFEIIASSDNYLSINKTAPTFRGKKTPTVASKK